MDEAQSAAGFPAAVLFSWLFCDRPHSYRKPGGAFDSRIGYNDDRPCGSHLIQVGEYLHLQLSAVQHVTLARQVAGLCGFCGSIRIQGFMAVGSGMALFVDIISARPMDQTGEIFLRLSQLRTGEGVPYPHFSTSQFLRAQAQSGIGTNRLPIVFDIGEVTT